MSPPKPLSSRSPPLVCSSVRPQRGHGPDHPPYEAIAVTTRTLKQANAMAARAGAGVKVVVQAEPPRPHRVEYGNGWSTPGRRRHCAPK